jgi:hypothetical protein
MNRRKFLAFLAAGGVVTATGLWLPGQKVYTFGKRYYPSRDLLEKWYQSKYEQFLMHGYTSVDGRLIRNIQSPFPYRGKSIQSLLDDNDPKT